MLYYKTKRGIIESEDFIDKDGYELISLEEYEQENKKLESEYIDKKEKQKIIDNKEKLLDCLLIFLSNLPEEQKKFFPYDLSILFSERKKYRPILIEEEE